MVDEETLAQIRKKLPAYIGTGKRYTHTLGVERETAALGTLFADAGLFDRFDIPRLRAAALLHDLTKQYTPEQQLQLCQRFSVQTDARLLASPKLLHARTGAVLARELFGKQIVDARVFRAIRYHTTARAHMDLWEKLLYLADYIEDTRTWPSCVALRQRFWCAQVEQLPPQELTAHLNATLLCALDDTIQTLLNEHMSIDPDTIDARNDLLLHTVLHPTGKEDG